MDDGRDRMVGGKRGKFGVQGNVGGVDKSPWAGRVRYGHIRMNLRDGDGERGTSVDDGVFAKEDDLARGGCVSHVLVGRIANPTYDR